MSERVRAFVAIKVNAELAAALLDLQARLRRRLPPTAVRWSSREQLHLTLQFLGDVASDRVPDLISAVRGACQDTPVLRLIPGDLGAFPGLPRPRVIWVGVGGDLELLQELQRRVAAATAAFGDHTEEREFHPHLTLGRVSGRGEADARPVGQALSGVSLGWRGAWLGTAVHLIRSQLNPAGAVYTDLAEFPLNPRAGL